MLNELKTHNRVNLATTCLTIITLILFFTMMKILSSLFIQVFLAILLAFLLHPVVDTCVRHRIPKWLTISFLITITFALMTLFLLLLINNLREFVMDLNMILPGVGRSLDALYAKLNLPPQVSSVFSVSTILRQVGQLSSSYIFKLANSSFAFISNAFFVSLLTAFLLLEMQNFYYKFATAFDSDLSARFSRIGHEVTSSMQRYLSIKTFVSALTGITIYVCILISGASYASMWGLLGFAFNFIPVIGSTVIMLLTMLMAVIQLNQSPLAMWFLLISMPGIQLLYGQILDPRLQGNSLNISPFIVLIGILFWGWMWGIPGVFLSVPMMVFLKILVANFGPYQHLGKLMEVGTPPKDWNHKDSV
ncbi:MAG: AI-2E family transporter [Spirochaetia bacterium]